jgi:hypothetical protein
MINCRFRSVMSDLQSKLLLRLFEEHNESCLKKILQILYAMDLPINEHSLPKKSLVTLWNRLHSLIDSSVKVKVLPFIGFVLQQVSVG